MSRSSVFLDEHFAGLREYLEALGWNVKTVQDVGLEGTKDSEVVKYAKKKDMILVTQDSKPADIAGLLGVRHIYVSPSVIAKAIDTEIRKKYM